MDMARRQIHTADPASPSQPWRPDRSLVFLCVLCASAVRNGSEHMAPCLRAGLVEAGFKATRFTRGALYALLNPPRCGGSSLR